MTAGSSAASQEGSFAFSSFYHAMLIPMLLVTLGLAWFARPSTKEVIPPNFSKFQVAFLAVWGFAAGADWLQGAYVYGLYAAYGFERHIIAQLFVAGFGAAGAFSFFAGALADKYGRKKATYAYCVLYIISCITKHFKNYNVLMFGRITGGCATALLFSCFECWMVSEHSVRHSFSGGLLGYMFGLMFVLNYAVAIASGVVAQFGADSVAFGPVSADSIVFKGGATVPFDIAIVFLVIAMVLISLLWEENYGGRNSQDDSPKELFVSAWKHLSTDKRTLAVGMIVACFEGAMFAFVFNWTPALASGQGSAPLGLIFSLFMMAAMCGSSVATLASEICKPVRRLGALLLLGIVAFSMAAIVVSRGHVMVVFSAFLAFEFCVGVYFPTVGVVKSEVVPERIRGTMYNIFRIPLNAIVVGLLLTNLSIVQCYMLCAVLLSAAAVSLVTLVASEASSEHLPLAKAV